MQLPIRLITFLILFLLLSGCEYPLSGDNFVDIKQPDATHNFNLSLYSETDTIRIYSTSIINYTINTNGLQLLGAQFSLNGKSWNVSDAAGSFSIRPEDFEPGVYTLSLSIASHSGTGSIADQSGLEGYTATRKWIFLIDKNGSAPVTVTKSITKDGYLKMSWPDQNQYGFKKYYLYCWSNTRYFYKEVTDPHVTSYTDSAYIGGSFNFRVDVVVNDNHYITGNSFSCNDPYPILKIDTVGLNSVRLHWNKSPYNARYIIQRPSDYTILFNSTTDTTCVVPYEGFDSSSYYLLYTLPANMNKLDVNYYKMSSCLFILGTRFSDSGTQYGYNPVEKVLYANNLTTMNCYDISTMTKVSSTTLSFYPVGFSSPNYSTKVATAIYNTIYVYPNKNLTNPFMLSTFWGITDNYLCLTDNNLMSFVDLNKFNLFDITNQKMMASFELPNTLFYYNLSYFATSHDGKYNIIATPAGIHIYTLDNGVAKETYTDNRNYVSILFDNYKTGYLYLTLDRSPYIEIRDPSNFNLIGTITMPSNFNILENFDPDTGFLLLCDSQHLYLYDCNKKEIIFNLNSSSNRPRFYGKTLFSDKGYYMNISKYLPK